MSVIANAIGTIVQKKLNGLLLDAAQNGEPILSAVGVGKPTADDPGNRLGDEVFIELSRKEVVQRIESTDDPDLWVDDPVVTVIDFKSIEGRGLQLVLNEPTDA